MGIMANKRTGYVYDLISAQHTQADHPERAERLAAILDELETSGLLADLRTHQFPFYPGTGALREIEDGEITLNVPLPADTGDIGFLQLYHDIFSPILRRFQPQIMLISAGYDCHWNDPLARLGLSQSGLARLSDTLVALAQELCGGKIVFARRRV